MKEKKWKKDFRVDLVQMKYELKQEEIWSWCHSVRKQREAFLLFLGVDGKFFMGNTSSYYAWKNGSWD
jgi:hypothetical protein